MRGENEAVGTSSFNKRIEPFDVSKTTWTNLFIAVKFLSS